MTGQLLLLCVVSVIMDVNAGMYVMYTSMRNSRAMLSIMLCCQIAWHHDVKDDVLLLLCRGDENSKVFAL